MKKHYLPKREAERVTWLQNFAAKLAVHAAAVGITPAEVTRVAAMDLFYAYIIKQIELSKTYTQNLTKFKNILSIAPAGTVLGPLPVLTVPAAPPVTEAGIFTVISAFVQRIKASTAYTTGIGEDLGIIGDESTFDAANFVPKLKGKAMPGMVEISFVKEVTDGINVYSHPVGSTDPNDWVKLAYDTESPYNDSRPLAVAGKPEVRNYRARAVISDVEIGQWSDILQVTYSG